jgi:hypothetical protein
MAKIIKGNLNVSNKLISSGKNAVTSINNIQADPLTNDIEINSSDISLSGNEGETIFFTDDSFISDKTNKIARIVNSNAELISEQQNIQSFNEVFSNWKRFSTNNTTTHPADPSELSAWQYESSTDSILSTLNSTTYIGFVSPEKYTKYQIEINVNAAQDNPAVADDDWIGFVMAYREIEGRIYTLSALRRTGNSPFSDVSDNTNWQWVIVYNFWYDQNSPNGSWLVQNGSTLATFTTGVWVNFPNGCNIKVSRDGDHFVLSTTQLNNTTNYIAQMTLDLNSDPRLEKFKEPSNIGYSAFSQLNANFRNIKFSALQNSIYNSITGDVYNYNTLTSTWVLDSEKTLYDYLDNGRIYTNPNTKKCFMVGSDTCKFVGGLSVGSTDTQVPDMSYFSYLNSPQGYQKLPNGLTMQWTTVTGTGSGITVNLPIPFINGKISAFSISNEATASNVFHNYSVDISTASLSSVVLYARTLTTGSVVSTGPLNCKVIVIGY